MATLTPNDYAKALYLALRDTDAKDVRPTVVRFVSIVRARGAERLLPGILAALPKAAEEADGDRRVTVESARKLSPEMLRAVLKAVAADARADIVTRLDPDLIGGVRVRMRDGVIDASVSGTIRKIKETLRRAG